MQQNQRAWLVAQQRMQEEIMIRNRKAQKEMLDAVLSARRISVESPPPVAPERERVKPPKPTLQKLSKEGGWTARMAKGAMGNSAGRVTLRCIRISPYRVGLQL